MMVFLFIGPAFLPDEITKEDNLVVIRNGTRFVRSGLRTLLPAEEQWPQKNETDPSRHYTYNFNVFVMMTICNFVNARKLNDEFWIFAGAF